MSMKKVVETSYLTAESAAQYRTILRYFYLQHERMRDFIAPEEILAHLRSIASFEAYEEEQLHQQLAQLVKWKNLVARQDMTNAKTVEEYKKKRFRYQSTPYTIEIERMLVTLENKAGDSFQGSLEKTQFERLLQSLLQLQEQVTKGISQSTEESMRLWEDILNYFKNIRTSTADYIAYINSEQTDQRMQTEAFLVYKNQFTAYLRDFIVSLQRTALQITEKLQELTSEQLTPFFQQLVEHRKQIPRFEEETDVTASWHQEFNEYWRSIQAWFLGSAHQRSELETLQWQTNEMIRRVTRYVQRIGERHQSSRSRKKDYLHLAKLFAESVNVDEAHKLSSVVFGSMTIQHLQLDESTTDNMYADTWEEPPVVLPLKPRTNRYREKTKPGAMIDNRANREKQMKVYLEERKKEKLLIEHYMREDEIKLSEVKEIDPFLRKVLLSWIGKSMVSKGNQVKTDYGFVVNVSLHKDRIITLEAEDGTLRMPDTTFTILRGGVKSGKSDNL